MGPSTARNVLRSLLCAWLIAAGAAWGGAFGVSPIRLDLDRNTRTGLVTVTSDDERRLYFQVKLFEWTQDAEGKDAYAESSDLVFFPQILTIEPREKRLLRVGLKGTPAAPEKAYRLFIEEMPDPTETKGGGAQVAVRLRFGVPIFVTGAKGEPAPEIVEAASAPGIARLVIRNGGERQVRFEELTVRAGDRVLGKATGWYVFPGASRAFEIPVDKAACPASGPLEVRATAEGRDLRRSLAASPPLCGS